MEQTKKPNKNFKIQKNYKNLTKYIKILLSISLISAWWFIRNSSYLAFSDLNYIYNLLLLFQVFNFVKRNAPLDVYTDFTLYVNFKGTVVMHKCCTCYHLSQKPFCNKNQSHHFKSFGLKSPFDNKRCTIEIITHLF